jgi:microcystin-dependent protein
MDTPFLGQIQAFGFNFAPRGWATCEGQILSISQNTALFSLLGTQFGGNGQTNFALPDLRGRGMVGVGQGPGLPAVQIGEQGGSVSITLTTAALPSHTHVATATSTLFAESLYGDKANPQGRMIAGLDNLYKTPDPKANLPLYSEAVITTVTNAPAGGSSPVDIRTPYLGVSICIALEGIFPSRN